MTTSAKITDVKIKAGSWLWKFFPRTTGAFALYNTIHIRRPIAPLAKTPALKNAFAMLLAHEYCHVLQYKKYPLTFLFRYFGGILWGAVRIMWSNARRKAVWWNVPFMFLEQWAKPNSKFRDAYLNHPFEVEARAYEKLHFVSWIPVVEKV
jgi:hypothetical protein